MTRIVLLAIALSLPAAGMTGVAHAQTTPRIEEWPVPWENTRPRDPFVDHQGAVWFVGQSGHYVGRFDPATAEFRRFELDPGTGPHNLIVDEAGMVWYAGNRAAHIGRLDPATGEIRKFTFDDPAARDPHTLVFDRSGNIWFTMQQSGFVGRFSPSTGDTRLVRIETPSARPYGIIMDADGRAWFNLFGVPKVAVVDPATFTVSEFDLPHERARGRRIEVTGDGAIWYVDYVRGQLARLDPATRTVEEFAAPAGQSSLPYALIVDDRDRLWYVETGIRPNRFVGFDSRTREIVATYEIPSGAGAVRHMHFHAPTRTIWFGTDANTIGRLHVPE